MTSLTFMECCQRLSVTPKTLRQWLAQAEMSLHPHPTDARISCLTSEQLHLLAALHGRVLHPSGNPLVGGGVGPGETTDADLRTQLAQLEALVAALQTQITDLTFQLLREREQRTEQRLQALAVQLRLVKDDALAPLSGSVPRVPEQPEMPPLVCHPIEKRAPLIPLIEYGARGRYVLISPEEGELLITLIRRNGSPGWHRSPRFGLWAKRAALVRVGATIEVRTGVGMRNEGSIRRITVNILASVNISRRLV